MTTFGHAKKIGMTRLMIDGKAVAVTALELPDNLVLQVKTKESDGYNALQMGFVKRAKKTTKPASGHLKKHAEVSEEKHSYQIVSEFKNQTLDSGVTTIGINSLVVGDYLDVQGTTKGRGFQGVVKRHGFGGQPRSHGHDHVRHGGSIGSRWPQRVMPGKKMAGRMGGVTVTVKNLKIVGVDADKKLFFLAGAVPGPNTGYVKFVTAKHA
jgi:large subunit ribosomal protein L3